MQCLLEEQAALVGFHLGASVDVCEVVGHTEHSSLWELIVHGQDADHFLLLQK